MDSEEPWPLPSQPAPLRHDAEPLDPWVVDLLLASVGCLVEVADDMAQVAGRPPLGGGSWAASEDPLARMVKTVAPPPPPQPPPPAASGRGETEGEGHNVDDRTAAVASAEATRTTADHVWGRFMSYANLYGIVALRRRFEEMDTRNLVTGKVTTPVGHTRGSAELRCAPCLPQLARLPNTWFLMPADDWLHRPGAAPTARRGHHSARHQGHSPSVVSPCAACADAHAASIHCYRCSSPGAARRHLRRRGRWAASLAAGV